MVKWFFTFGEYTSYGKNHLTIQPFNHLITSGKKYGADARFQESRTCRGGLEIPVCLAVKYAFSRQLFGETGWVVILIFDAGKNSRHPYYISVFAPKNIWRGNRQWPDIFPNLLFFSWICGIVRTPNPLLLSPLFLNWLTESFFPFGNLWP